MVIITRAPKKVERQSEIKGRRLTCKTRMWIFVFLVVCDIEERVERWKNRNFGKGSLEHPWKSDHTSRTYLSDHRFGALSHTKKKLLVTKEFSSESKLVMKQIMFSESEVGCIWKHSSPDLDKSVKPLKYHSHRRPRQLAAASLSEAKCFAQQLETGQIFVILGSLLQPEVTLLSN